MGSRLLPFLPPVFAGHSDRHSDRHRSRAISLSFKRRFFRQILAEPKARELLLNSLAVGEADSAKDLDRIADHVQDEALSRKIYRHFAEENKHARLFRKHLESQGFTPKPLPPELDYETTGQRYGMGTPKARIDDPRPFDLDDLILFFCGSKAGEERACKEMEGLIDSLADDPKTVEVLKEIHHDEIRHVSYATEELNKIAAAGHSSKVVRTLRAIRRNEARAHRQVSLAFMRRLMQILGYPAWVRFFAAIAIDVEFAQRYLFPGGLDQPILMNAMPTPLDRARETAGSAS
jgi:rubrerythrin